ncbi:MAG: DUF4293 domain-containing protein [Bacteroidota bacterium]
MIPRIQNLYLFLTTMLSLLFLKGGIINFMDKSGSIIKVTFNGLLRNTDGQAFELIDKLLPLSAIIVLIPAISLITILFFKNRKVQLLLAMSLIILVAGLIIFSCYYCWFVISGFGAAITPGFKLAIPVLILIFSILAYRGIKKDENLIRSYERLR